MKIETAQFRPDPIWQQIDSAERAILRLFEEGRPVFLGFSGGKDSSVVAGLVFNAARRHAEADGKPFVLVTTSDTLVENPEVRSLYLQELRKMVSYSNKHGIAIHAEVVKPSLAATWQMKVLTGRGLPSFPSNSSDCSIDLKVNPQTSFRSSMRKQFAGGPAPVTCLGTRFDESAVRGARMRERGDHAEIPVVNKQGDLVLSPIAHWTEDDVFEYMGLRTSNLIDAYSDFEDTKRIYAHSAGTSCAIVAQAIYEGAPKSTNKGCGARHGCWTCQKSEDKSLEAMIEFDPRYEYARGLNKFNKFIRATRNDWSLRHWVGRTIKGGYVEIKPDIYHPKMLRMLTRFMLQLDHDERVRASRAREEPKFQALPLNMMIAIDAMQNINGVAKPFSVWADYVDITQRGIRYNIPDVPVVPATPQPQTRYLYVGAEWDNSAEHDGEWSGLRDIFVEAMTEGSACDPEMKLLKNGNAVWAMPTALSFEIDMESASMIEEFEIDHLLRMHAEGNLPGGIARGYKWYAQYGCLVLSSGQQTKHDEILRRTAFKDRMGLTLDYDAAKLYADAIPFSALPLEAQLAWKGGKSGTNEDVTENVSGTPSLLLPAERVRMPVQPQLVRSKLGDDMDVPDDLVLQLSQVDEAPETDLPTL